MFKFFSRNFHFLLLLIIIFCLYYKFFLFGKIPFPGDLLVASYSPWFDYYKFPVQNPLISDVFSQFFLWKYLSIDSFKNWQWPLWNPYSFTGTPLLATYHSAALYPLNILLFLPKYFGLGLFISSQTLIGLIGMYLLLSLWVGSKLARLTGSVIFALAGLMTTWLELGTPGHAIVWLPSSIYFIERFWTKLQIRYLLMLIGSQAFLILAGHAQILTYSLVILILYMFINSLDTNIKRFSIRFFPPLIALSFALLLSSIQLLPSLDLLNKSIRLTEVYSETSNFGLLPIKDSLKFIVADFFGNPVTRNYWGFLNYSETSGFFGTLTLPLLLFSYIYLRKNRVTIFFLSLLTTSLFLSFDNYVVHTIYSLKIPFLTSSYASRMLFIAGFSVAILSAFAIDQIIKDQHEVKKFLRLTIWAWASIIGILIGSIFAHFITQRIIKMAATAIHSKTYLDSFLNDGNYILSNVSVAMRNCVIPVLIITLFLISLIVIRKVKPTLIFLLLLILTSFDLGRYFLKFNPFVSQELIFPEVPALQFLQKQPGLFRIGREHAEVLPPNTWTAYNLQSLEGYDPLYLNEYAKFMRFLNGGDIKSGSSSRYAEISQNYASSYIDATNVRFFIGVGRDKNNLVPGGFINPHFSEAGYKKVFQDKSAVILENPHALERVYFAQSFIGASEEEIENIFMNDKNFDPRKNVALLKDLEISSVNGEGSAKIIEYSPNKVRIKTETKSDEILVLADQYEEGWKARIDNKEIKISPANLIFRAIKVPKGEHEVLFYYWPKSFEMGMQISAVTILVILASSIFVVKKRIF